MKRALGIGLALALGVLPAVALAASSEEEAGDISEVDKDALGPLRERIPPVTGHLFLKKHRFELSPSITFSIKDAFFTKYIFGLTAAYHITEAVALNGRFGYSIPTVAGAAQICIPQGAPGQVGCNSPSYGQVNGIAPGQLQMLGGLDFEWAPLYGKIALFSEKFLHFDMYGILGASYVQYAGPATTGTGGCANANGCSATDSAIGANLGLGMRFVVTKWGTVRTELRDLFYQENVIVPAQGTTLRQQLLFEIGFSFFLPTTFQES